MFEFAKVMPKVLSVPFIPGHDVQVQFTKSSHFHIILTHVTRKVQISINSDSHLSTPLFCNFTTKSRDFSE